MKLIIMQNIRGVKYCRLLYFLYLSIVKRIKEGVGDINSATGVIVFGDKGVAWNLINRLATEIKSRKLFV